MNIFHFHFTLSNLQSLSNSFLSLMVQIEFAQKKCAQCTKNIIGRQYIEYRYRIFRTIMHT